MNFNLTIPTAYRFLERFAKLADCNQQLFALANYLT